MDVGKDPATGKRKQASFGPFRTKTEAKKELLKIKNQVDDGSYFKVQKIFQCSWSGGLTLLIKEQ
ncbi:Arm DNA-binding domain-containing protein [Parageobacillus sp. VR-IP]|uniref:Arm DNA-binding domain-containing protein n=1 Tax=Parageobacillus sp. VR-IP TaxID=2742205 RepID=UPI0028124234|nr:Arm DNA-binding domain-containing protein [Parageobacillus sp. VR-IP]